MRKQDPETCIRSHDSSPLDLELELGFLTPGPVLFPLYYTVSLKLSVIFLAIIKLLTSTSPVTLRFYLFFHLFIQQICVPTPIPDTEL